MGWKLEKYTISNNQAIHWSVTRHGTRGNKKKIALKIKKKKYKTKKTFHRWCTTQVPAYKYKFEVQNIVYEMLLF